MSRPDEQLVAGYLAGDERCFSVLIARYQEPIVRLLARLMRDPSAAEDAAQEAFFAAACSLESLEKPESFRAWLYRIAYRKGVLAMERKRRVPSSLSLSIDPDLVATMDHPNRERHEPPIRERLRRILDRLDGEDRAILDMRFLDGFRHAEIARITGCSTGRVRRRVWSLKRKLLQDLGGAEGAPA